MCYHVAVPPKKKLQQQFPAKKIAYEQPELFHVSGFVRPYLPELNVEGVTGFLCDVGDVDAMAEKALYVLEDCDRLERFKQAALDRAKDFELGKITPQYEQYYQTVIEQSKNKSHSG